MLNKRNDWRSLYKIAFVATTLMIVLIPVQSIVYFVSPPPSSAEGFLTLYHQSTLRGLLSLDLLYLVNSALIIPLYLALGISLRCTNKSLVLLALTFGFVGLAVYFPSNPAFEMLTLSRQYAAASEARITALVSSADTMLAIYTGTAFNVYYVFNAVALLLLSYVMLKSGVYKKTVAIIGLASGFLMIIPSTAGTLGLIFSFLSLIPWVVFSVMIARKFLAMSKE